MRKGVATLLALVAMTSACSTSEQGQPLPGSTQQPPSSRSTEPPTDLPPRPEDLPVADVNPCDLLSEAQRSELNVVRARETTEKTEAECAFTVEADSRRLDLRVVADTREGVDAWLRGQRNVTVEQTTVDGFGAANFWLKGGSGADCNTAVDVAAGQHLKVTLRLPGVGWTQEKLCETTDRFAAAALATLRAG